MLGVNYWLTPSTVVKLAYADNRGLDGRDTDRDQFYLQLSHGF
jgi:hypothetical protein